MSENSEQFCGAEEKRQMVGVAELLGL